MFDTNCLYNTARKLKLKWFKTKQISKKNSSCYLTKITIWCEGNVVAPWSEHSFPIPMARVRLLGKGKNQNIGRSSVDPAVNGYLVLLDNRRRLGQLDVMLPISPFYVPR